MADSVLIDPLARTITLHDHTWFGHIVKGHPEMRTLRSAVELAITSPANICYSKSSVDCRIYFAAHIGPMPYVAVVADVTRGFVLTAYLAKQIKGIVEW